MKLGYTDLIILLDRSGSMNTIKDDTIGGIRKLVDDQKKVPGECRLSFIQFDKENYQMAYDVVYSETPLADVKELNLEPRGWTPLLDAVGRAINETGKRLADKPEHERPEFVVMVIATDGQENASHEFSKDQIRQMIEHQRDVYKWHFTFIGANQDAFGEASRIGIPQAAVLNYAANSVGTRAAYSSVSAAINSLRTYDNATLCYNDSDVEQQKKAGWKPTASSTSQVQ